MGEYCCQQRVPVVTPPPCKIQQFVKTCIAITLESIIEEVPQKMDCISFAIETRQGSSADNRPLPD